MERIGNALLALVLSAILWSVFGLQYFEHEEPCPLCLLQRLGMLGVAFGALLNVKFGIRRSHYSLSLFSAIFGGFVALRQIAFHICPGFPTFGKPCLGLNLYTWAFIIFASSVTYIALLMLIFNGREKEHRHVKWLGQLAFFSIFLVSLTNIITTLIQCGLGDCEV